MAAQFSKVIKAKDEQLVMKDQEIKAVQVSLLKSLTFRIETRSKHAGSA